MKRLMFLVATCVGMASAGDALAQVYKYSKKDGTVIYTDRLSDLPPARRAYYAKLEREAKERRRARENMLGKAELERREAEAERARLKKAEMAEAERQKRLAVIEDTLDRIRKRNETKAGNRKAWKDRMKKAKAELQLRLEEFRKAKQEYAGLATKADFALLPGQNKKKHDLAKKLKELEAKVDAAINEVYVVIPEQARKAGVPPGWLR